VLQVVFVVNQTNLLFWKKMANNHSETERRLWAAADEFRANSELKSSEYATPVLGLIFLRYADHKFTIAETELKGKGSGRRVIGKEDYQAGEQLL